MKTGLQHIWLSSRRNCDRGNTSQSMKVPNSKYFEVRTTPVRGIQIEPKNEVMQKARRYYGYFVLISNEVKTPSKLWNFTEPETLLKKHSET